MTRKIKDFNEFKEIILNDTSLVSELSRDPKSVLDRFEQKSPLDWDSWIYRIAVTALGLIVLIIIGGVVLLIGSGEINNDNDVPTILTAIGSAAIGALAGLLSPIQKK